MGSLLDAAKGGFNNMDALLHSPKPETAQPKGTSYNSEADAPAQTPWDRLMEGHSSKRRATKTEAPAVNAEYVVSGLVERGLPQHVAEGFAMNFQDESGFDAGINERNPTVAGSRGGFGLYQLTGSRRTQYEQYASEKGTEPSDPEAQMDFLVWELENTEKRAAGNILNSTTAGEAGAAIVNDFLRPAAEHRQKRASKYLGEPARPQARPQTKLWLDF
jgi:hypothetical protein